MKVFFVVVGLVFCVVGLVSSIPVSMMLSLNQVNSNGGLNDPDKLQSDLYQLKSGGVDGIMSDVWWGIVEQTPQNYNWTAYLQIAGMAQNAGLTFQPIMSFHQCGGNVGDDCNIPIPSWADLVASSLDLFYKDPQNRADHEYISLSGDYEQVFPTSNPNQNRTALQVYSDYMNSFAAAFSDYSPSIVNTIQVGLGPSGEMRFPGYQESKWTYCGVGEFQCYDGIMLKNLSAAASAAGQPDWGNGGPDDAGVYDNCPSDAGFWQEGTKDNYASPYGQFFLGWYSNILIDHGSAILQEAQKIFSPKGVETSGKVAGIHWWYNSNSHGSEATAGYYNTNFQNAYLNIANQFAVSKSNFDFTALELKDNTQYGGCGSKSNIPCGSHPEELVDQTILASQSAGIRYEGENALPICPDTSGPCNQGAFDQVYYKSTKYGPIHRFTFLRISDNLLYNTGNWNMFTSFVSEMAAAGTS